MNNLKGQSIEVLNHGLLRLIDFLSDLYSIATSAFKETLNYEH